MPFSQSSKKVGIRSPRKTPLDGNDLVIQRLKEEIYGLRENEQDFRLLSKQLKELEYKYEQLQREKIQNETENKSVLETNLRRILNYKQQMDIQNEQTDQKQELIEDHKNEIDQLRTSNEHQSQDILKLNLELSKQKEVHFNASK